MGIVCIPAIPVILKSPHSYFHRNICREFDFTGILQGFPALDVGKPCKNLNFWRYTCKICRNSLQHVRHTYFSIAIPTCLPKVRNPHDNYMHVTGNTLRHRDSLHILWGKHLQCTAILVERVTSKGHFEIKRPLTSHLSYYV